MVKLVSAPPVSTPATKAPKAAKGPKAAKAPKASPATKAAKVETKAPATRPKVEGIRKPQGRVLEYLSRTPKRAVNRADISSGAEVDNAFLTEYLGSTRDEIRVKNDAKVFPSLISLGFLEFEAPETGPVVYRITAAGVVESKRYEKEKAEKEKAATKAATPAPAKAPAKAAKKVAPAKV